MSDRPGSAVASPTSLWRAILGEWRAGIVSKVGLVLLGVVVALGITFRTRGMFGTPMPFWLDECAWGNLLFDKPLHELLIRPIGFMAVSKLIAAHVSASEPWLRLLPWMAGISTLFVASAFGLRVFSGWGARLFLVATLGLNTEAIDYAREFKPYSCGLFLHLSVLCLGVRAVGTRRRRDLVVALSVAVLAALFTQDIVFAYPGLFLVLGLAALRERRKADLGIVAVAALSAATLLVLQYVFIWRHLGDSNSDYWGKRYDVFFVDQGFASHLRWHALKYLDIVAFPGAHGTWFLPGEVVEKLSRVASAYRKLWLALHVGGAAVLLLQRRFTLAALLFLPLVTASLFNVAGLWPWGAFRTNTFLLAYTCTIASFALDAGALKKTGFAAFVPACALLLPVFYFDPEMERRPHAPIRSLPMREVIRQLVDAQGDVPPAPETLVLDSYHCEPWAYYSRFNPVTVAMLEPGVGSRFRPVCADTDGELAAILRKQRVETGRTWLLRAKGKHRMFADRMVKRDFVIESTARVEASTRYALRVE